MIENHNALPKGYRLQEYEVLRVLGIGGFGITYLAFDNHLDKAVAIKEYLPNDLAIRADGHSVHPKSTSDQDDFQWGLDRFMDEARTLARFHHPHIVQVYRYFEAHETAYIVMEYAEGTTLAAHLVEHGPLEEDALKAILLPLLDGLEQVHQADLLHRDIKPDNIILRAEGGPVLIDFGAARQQVISRSRRYSAIVSPGYSPHEQYSTQSKQGPWTDIYALGAVCYLALTGKRPPDAADRVQKDPMKPALEKATGRASPAFLCAIDRALAVFDNQRPQDLSQWRALIEGESGLDQAVGISPRSGLEEDSSRPQSAGKGGPTPQKLTSTGHKWAYPILGMLVLAIAAVVIRQFPGPIPEPEPLPSPSGEQVMPDPLVSAVQDELRRLGRDVPEDGQMGSETLEQIRAFEHASGEAETGEPTESLLADLEASPRWPGEKFRDCPECPEMVVIPTGEFSMGSPRSEPGRNDNEGLPRQVSVPMFALAKTEVTVGEFRRFVEASDFQTDAEIGFGGQSGCARWSDNGWVYDEERTWRDPGYTWYASDDDRPVLCISWNDADAYVTWLSQETMQDYRLPSEAEWEYAARAKTNTRFNTGDCITDQQANFRANAPATGCDAGLYRRHTTPVGYFQANRFRLHDMHGNVAEWTEDCWQDSHDDAPSDGSASRMGNCSRRVLRDGFWFMGGNGLRSAKRSWGGTSFRTTGTGFRPAKTLEIRQVNAREPARQEDPEISPISELDDLVGLQHELTIDELEVEFELGRFQNVIAAARKRWLDNGDTYALYALGKAYLTSGAVDKGVAHLMRAADSGEARARCLLSAKDLYSEATHNAYYTNYDLYSSTRAAGEEKFKECHLSRIQGLLRADHQNPQDRFDVIQFLVGNELEKLWDDDMDQNERTRIAKVAESLCAVQTWSFCGLFLNSNLDLEQRDLYQQQLLDAARGGDPTAIMRVGRLTGRMGSLPPAEASEMMADAGYVFESLQRTKRAFRSGRIRQASEWHSQIARTAGANGLINALALSEYTDEAMDVAARERLKQIFDWSDSRVDLELSCVCRRYTGSCGTSRDDADTANSRSDAASVNDGRVVVTGAGLCVSSVLY